MIQALVSAKLVLQAKDVLLTFVRPLGVENTVYVLLVILGTLLIFLSPVQNMPAFVMKVGLVPFVTRVALAFRPV